MKTAHAIIIAGAIIAGAILIKDDFPTKPAHALVEQGDYMGVSNAQSDSVWVVSTVTGTVRRCNIASCSKWRD
jgi:hypothetical protein